jgi:hypothetical protein
MRLTNTDAREATKMLWDAYHPYTVWYGFVAVGLVTAVGMIVYATVAKRWVRENA